MNLVTITMDCDFIKAGIEAAPSAAIQTQPKIISEN